MIKHSKLTKIQSMMNINMDLLQWFIIFFDRKTALLVDKSTSGGKVKNEITSNKWIAKELHKLIIRKFEKRKVHSFIDNIWGADVACMQCIRKFNKEFRFLLCVVDIYSKYPWVIPLKAQKGITITNAVKIF